MSNTPANPNQAPAPAASATKAPKSIAAIVGLILGIIALVLSAMPIINNFAFILGVVGLIFGIVGVVGTRDKKKSGKGMAVASVIIAALACVIVLASQAVYSAALDEAGAQLDKATGDATEEILGSEVDVTLGDLTMKKGSYGTIESSMPITDDSRALSRSQSRALRAMHRTEPACRRGSICQADTSSLRCATL